MSWFRRLLIWLGFIKAVSWFPVEWGINDPQSSLRALFPTLKGTFQRPSAPVARPYRRLRPRYKGRPAVRYRRALRFYIVEPYTP